MTFNTSTFAVPTPPLADGDLFVVSCDDVGSAGPGFDDGCALGVISDDLFFVNDWHPKLGARQPCPSSFGERLCHGEVNCTDAPTFGFRGAKSATCDFTAIDEFPSVHIPCGSIFGCDPFLPRGVCFVSSMVWLAVLITLCCRRGSGREVVVGRVVDGEYVAVASDSAKPTKVQA